MRFKEYGALARHFQGSPALSGAVGAGAYNPRPMPTFRSVLPATLLALVLSPARADWPQTAERLMAADAAFYAPPDLRRQLAKHRDELMAGVDAARSAAAGPADRAARRRDAARRARDIASAIRKRASFADVARSVGALVHDAAAGFPPPPGENPDSLLQASRSSSFIGFPREPFAAPEGLAALPLSDTSARQAYDAAVTLSTRLLAWIWKEAGGDASVVKKHPEARGPYAVRVPQAATARPAARP